MTLFQYTIDSSEINIDNLRFILDDLLMFSPIDQLFPFLISTNFLIKDLFITNCYIAKFCATNQLKKRPHFNIP